MRQLPPRWVCRWWVTLRSELVISWYILCMVVSNRATGTWSYCIRNSATVLNPMFLPLSMFQCPKRGRNEDLFEHNIVIFLFQSQRGQSCAQE